VVQSNENNGAIIDKSSSFINWQKWEKMDPLRRKTGYSVYGSKKRPEKIMFPKNNARTSFRFVQRFF